MPKLTIINNEQSAIAEFEAGTNLPSFTVSDYELRL